MSAHYFDVLIFGYSLLSDFSTFCFFSPNFNTEFPSFLFLEFPCSLFPEFPCFFLLSSGYYCNKHVSKKKIYLLLSNFSRNSVDINDTIFAFQLFFWLKLIRSANLLLSVVNVCRRCCMHQSIIRYKFWWL